MENPEQTPVRLVDSHCHLDLEQFQDDRDAVMERARAQGVVAVVNPGIDLAHSLAAIALGEQYPEVYAAVGIHPNSADKVGAAVLDELARLAGHPKVVAVGEIGLDYYWDRVEPQVQQQAFWAQLELAASLGLPVIIHNREADQDVIKILEAWVNSATFRNSPLADRPFAGVLHAFSGDRELAERAYGWNFVLGLGGPVTFKNARRLQALVPTLRLDRLMVETDAPYLTPHPYRGRRNEPGHVRLVAEKLADLYDRPLHQVAAQTTATAVQFFGLPLPVDSETALHP